MSIKIVDSVSELLSAIEVVIADDSLRSTLVEELYVLVDGTEFKWLYPTQIEEMVVTEMNEYREEDYVTDDFGRDISFDEYMDANFDREFQRHEECNREAVSIQTKHAVLAGHDVTILGNNSLSIVRGLRAWNCPNCAKVTFLWNFSRIQPILKHCSCLSRAEHVKFGLLLERSSPYIHKFKEMSRKCPGGVVKLGVLKTFINQFELENIEL
jgi:hypothetical protein